MVCKRCGITCAHASLESLGHVSTACIYTNVFPSKIIQKVLFFPSISCPFGDVSYDVQSFPGLARQRRLCSFFIKTGKKTSWVIAKRKVSAYKKNVLLGKLVLCYETRQHKRKTKTEGSVETPRSRFRTAAPAGQGGKPSVTSSPCLCLPLRSRTDGVDRERRVNYCASALLYTVLLYQQTSLGCCRYDAHVVDKPGASVVAYAGLPARSL